MQIVTDLKYTFSTAVKDANSKSNVTGLGKGGRERREEPGKRAWALPLWGGGTKAAVITLAQQEAHVLWLPCYTSGLNNFFGVLYVLRWKAKHSSAAYGIYVSITFL